MSGAHKLPAFAGIAGALVLIAWISASVFLHRTPDIYAQSASFGGVSLTLDYATTAAEREQGLGGRTNVPENYGMLFVFPNPDLYGFWMKDMLIPIDIFWIDAAGRVVDVRENVATSTYPTVFYPHAPAMYVLETAAGFANANGIATGTPLIVKNGLQQLPGVSK